MREKKWIKLRHYIVRNLAYWVIYPYSVWKYGIKIEKFKEQEKRPYLVLYNHQTAFDQFFVGMALKGPVYYVASEDLFSKGFISSVIRYIVAPIPIKKQTLDIAAIKCCMRVAKEGGTIAIAPEGNRTFSGKTEYINPAIASLAKKLKLPILLYRIEGGYGVHPRWSDVVRKGKMRAGVFEAIMPEEYEKLSKEELFERINKGLFVDEANADNTYLHPKRAEFLERAIYVCPYCGLATLESNGDKIKCKKCNREVSYGTDTSLKGVGFDFPFAFVNDWYDYQKDFVNKLDLTAFTDEPLYKEEISLFEVELYKNKSLLKQKAEIRLYGNRIVINEAKPDEIVFEFQKISAVTILGKNILNVYTDSKVYQLKGEKRFNGLKYVNFYNRYINIVRGDEDGKFLGL